MENHIVVNNNMFIDVRYVLDKLKITNKLNKKQYDYILVIKINNNDTTILKFCYFLYYKKIKQVLLLIFDNCDAFWETKKTDTLYIRNIKRQNKLLYITNNQYNPDVQWIITYRKNKEFYNNDIESYKEFIDKKTKNKNIFNRLYYFIFKK